MPAPLPSPCALSLLSSLGTAVSAGYRPPPPFPSLSLGCRLRVPSCACGLTTLCPALVGGPSPPNPPHRPPSGRAPFGRFFVAFCACYLGPCRAVRSLRLASSSRGPPPRSSLVGGPPPLLLVPAPCAPLLLTSSGCSFAPSAVASGKGERLSGAGYRPPPPVFSRLTGCPLRRAFRLPAERVSLRSPLLPRGGPSVRPSCANLPRYAWALPLSCGGPCLVSLGIPALVRESRAGAVGSGPGAAYGLALSLSRFPGYAAAEAYGRRQQLRAHAQGLPPP